MRRILVTVMIMGIASCWNVRADAGKESIRVEKRHDGDVLKITGRIKSRHVRFRKGKSVRAYHIVTPDLIKIPLPRSHVEHRDGTISGIQLRLWKGKDVELVCEGRLKDDAKKGLLVTVEKILSLVPAKG
jgi:hypothetical protein